MSWLKPIPLETMLDVVTGKYGPVVVHWVAGNITRIYCGEINHGYQFNIQKYCERDDVRRCDGEIWAGSCTLGGGHIP